jgi:hypothetical protein
MISVMIVIKNNIGHEVAKIGKAGDLSEIIEKF